MKAKGRAVSSPVKKSKTLVKDKVSYAPNYDAKMQTGMEAARMKVGKKIKGK